MKKYYCENCSEEELKEYYEDRLGTIFCNKGCYLDSAEWREKGVVKNE